MTMFPRLLVATVAAALLPFLAAGCGPQAPVNSPEQYEVGSLDEVGQLYSSSYAVTKKAPKSLKNLVRADVFAGGFESIKKGEIIVYWGVTPTTSDAADAGEVLAYKADVPEKGGYVLLKDLTMKTMTPAEFQAAPKPPGPTSAETKAETKK